MQPTFLQGGTMLKSALFLLVSSLAFHAQAAPTSAMAYGQYSGLPAPLVESVMVDAGQITINGRFHSSSAPVLLLGKHRLEVSESSRTQVTAKLPPSLQPATYRLLVNHNNAPANTTALYLKIPAFAQ
jgi:hypothetical protein